MSDKNINIYDLNQLLLTKLKFIFRIRAIHASYTDSKTIHAYCFSLKKSTEMTLEEQVMEFFHVCENALSVNQKILTDTNCFKIISDDFEATYYIEFWYKNADKYAYIENGEVKTEFLHRIGCEQAALQLRKMGFEKRMLGEINEITILQSYKNYADRYCALLKFPALVDEIVKKYRT